MPPRGVRNHNPGNIRRGQSRWRGAAEIQSDPEFVQFKDAASGIRALAVLLLNYYRRHGLDTVGALIARYAPAAENNTSAYVGQVARKLRVAPDTPIRVNDPATLLALCAAVIAHENGASPYSKDFIETAVRAALKIRSSDPRSNHQTERT
jgi:hypothetical protein